MASKLNELQEILELLNEKLSVIQENGDLTTAYSLEDTIEKLKLYIREKEGAKQKEHT